MENTVLDKVIESNFKKWYVQHTSANNRCCFCLNFNLTSHKE